MKKYVLMCAVIFFGSFSLPLQAKSYNANTWRTIVDQAAGQTVRVYAPNGEKSAYVFLQWAAGAVLSTYGIRVEIVSSPPIDNTVDVIWALPHEVYNMSQHKQLLPTWLHQLPNAQYIDDAYLYTGIHATGQAAAWGRGQLVFLYDSARISHPPQDVHQLLVWAKAHNKAFAYPPITTRQGLAFIKQILVQVTSDITVFARPAHTQDITKALSPLWAYLDTLHPFVWGLPADVQHLHRWINDGAVTLAVGSTPYGLDKAIKNHWLPKTIRAKVPDSESISTVHYLTITNTAPNPQGAKVFIDFLLTPLIQASKASADFWGDMTVLSMDKIRIESKLFDLNTYSDSAPKNAQSISVDIHPSWDNVIIHIWNKKYGQYAVGL